MKKTGCELEEYKSIANLTSIGIGTVVRAILYPDSSEKMIYSIKLLCELHIPYLVVGRMSNVLFRNETFDGVIIATTKINGYILAENKIEMLCGASVAKMAHDVKEKNLGGFEGLIGIPGTLGGMIKGNAGAYGCEIADTFVRAFVYDVSREQVCYMTKDDMQFSYRYSVLKNKNLVLLSAEFEPIYRPYKEICTLMMANKDHRLASQPHGIPSLGSVFKRYNGVSAGFYIDKAGMKGYRVGGAEVSDKHAGFIVNAGGATAKDVLDLIVVIKDRVMKTFGIMLEEEIEII